MNSILKQAIQLRRQGKIDEAICLLHKEVNQGCNDPNTIHFLGLLLEANEQLIEAIQYLDEAIRICPNNPDYLFGYGNALKKAQHNDKAKNAFIDCLKLRSEHADAWIGLSNVYQNSGQMDEAVNAAENSVKADPDKLISWLTYLGTLGYNKQYNKAVEVADIALARFPNNWKLFHMIGNVITSSGKDIEGYQWFLKAYEIKKDDPKLLNSIGLHLSKYGRPLDGLPYHRRALELDQNNLYTIHCLGFAYLKAGYPTDALPQFLEAIEKGYQNIDCHDSLLLASQYLDEIDEAQIFHFHKLWNNTFIKGKIHAKSPELRKKQIYKIGFISGDLHEHSVSRFMTCLIRNIPSETFHVTFYSLVNTKNEATIRLKSLGGSWDYCKNLTDEALTAKIKEDNIDVLIDLSGHTGQHKLFVFARKPSPIQISWLGYPNTTGLDTIDYRFSDKIADPTGESDTLSTERIIRINDGFHCFEPPIKLPKIADTPAIKNSHITFGSFNNQSKITPLTIQRWLLLLNEFPDSKLLLKNKQLLDPRNQENWINILGKNGIHSDRVTFCDYKMNLEEHYKQYQNIDIALDTFPYNGTTTTCEALWMGVPVLTYLGNSQRSRTAASLLTHAGMEDWVAKNDKHWLEIAKKWARDPIKLNAYKQGIRQKVSISPIGNGAQFAKKFYKMIETLIHQHLPN